MMTTRRLVHAFSALVLALASATWISAKEKWDPVNPNDLKSIVAPKGETVPAEVLFHHVELANHEGSGSIFRFYRRIKIYTPQGVEQQRKIQIDTRHSETISSLAVRLMKPNGEVREFDRKDFTETTVSKSLGSTIKTRIFVVPGVEPSDILEARFRITSSFLFAPLFFAQETIPVRDYSFTIEGSTTMALSFINLPTGKIVNTKYGLAVVAHDIPPFVEEPQMPPQLDFRGTVHARFAWMNREQRDGWLQTSERLYKEFKANCTPDKKVRAKAAELVSSQSDPEEKLRTIFHYCHDIIINTAFENSVASQRRNQADHKTRSPSQVIADGRGEGHEIEYLFASLCSAAGFDVRLAECASRENISSIQIPDGWQFLSNYLVAVKVGSNYRYFSAAEHFIPYGLLHWYEEGTQAILGNHQKFEGGLVPHSDPGKTVKTRRGTLQLNVDGSIEGDVVETNTGFFAGNWRTSFWEQTPEEWETDFKNSFLRLLPAAELTALKFVNALDTTQPLEIHYHLRIPDYVTQVGDTLVLAPNVFCAGETPLLTASKRTYPITFPFPNQVHDAITVALPEGYQIKNGNSPAPVGTASGSISQTVALSYSTKRRTIHYDRNFLIGGNGALTFAPSTYDALKLLFELVQAGDTHAIVLERTTGQAVNTLPAQSPK